MKRIITASKTGKNIPNPDYNISIISAEVYWDIQSHNPFLFVKNIEPLCKTVYKDIIESPRIIQSKRAKSVSGKFYEGERFKIYTKKDDTIRFEYSIGGKRFKKIKLSKVLENFDVASFEDKVSYLELYARNMFRPITHPVNLPPVTNLNYLETCFQLIKSLPNDQKFFEYIIAQYISTGRIKSETRYHDRYHRLYKESVFVRTARGIYTFAPEFEKVINLLVEDSTTNKKRKTNA